MKGQGKPHVEVLCGLGIQGFDGLFHTRLCSMRYRGVSTVYHKRTAQRDAQGTNERYTVP